MLSRQSIFFTLRTVSRLHLAQQLEDALWEPGTETYLVHRYTVYLPVDRQLLEIALMDDYPAQLFGYVRHGRLNEPDLLYTDGTTRQSQWTNRLLRKASLEGLPRLYA